MSGATVTPAGDVTTARRSAWLERARWDDQVQRRAELEAFRPDAEITRVGPGTWKGSLVTGGKRKLFAGTSLERLLGQMRPAVLADAIAAVTADFSGWHVWVSDAGHWYATRTGRQTGRGRTMTADAPSEARLRAVLEGLR